MVISYSFTCYGLSLNIHSTYIFLEETLLNFPHTYVGEERNPILRWPITTPHEGRFCTLHIFTYPDESREYIDFMSVAAPAPYVLTYVCDNLKTL